MSKRTPKSSQEKANARLISAAPDLLEALKAMAAKCPCQYSGWDEMCDNCKQAKLAIYKAEGKHMWVIRKGE